MFMVFAVLITRTRVTAAGECRRAAAKKKVLNRFPQNPLTMCDLIYYNPPNSRCVSQHYVLFSSSNCYTYICTYL